MSLMKFDLAHLLSTLRQDEDGMGIWYTDGTRPVSYPEQGNAECFEIEDSSFWFLHRNHCILGVLERFPPEGPILDLGGGNGFVSAAIQRAGYTAVLLEPGATGCANAKKRGVSPIICGNIEDLHLGQNLLPAIGLFDVLEHIEEDTRFLSLLAQKLRATGRLYVTVPAFPWLWSKEDEVSGHKRRYSLRRASKVLREAGFDIEYATYMFFPLPPGILLYRVFRIGNARFDERSRGAHKWQLEHRGLHSGLKSVIERLLAMERIAIRKQIKVPFGSSCLIVARKNSS